MQKITCWLLLFGVLLLFQQCESDEGSLSSESSPADALYFSADKSSSGPPSGGGNNPNIPEPKAGLITAGEWNDLEKWPFWLDLLKKSDWSQKESYWKFYTTHRYTIVLKDKAGKGLFDARVEIRNKNNTVVWEARTDNTGQASVFPDLFTGQPGQYSAWAEYKNKRISLGVLDSPHRVLEQSFDVSNSKTPNADVMLVVDATGSMGDEIQYLKVEMNDVLKRVVAQSQQVRLRTGSVFYRDHGDDYLTRPFAFTTQTGDLIKFINEQSAGGGGDFPEAVDDALSAAIEKQNWSEDALCRILFLVLDAPPHYTPQVVERMQRLVRTAARKGIKIIPITASGIDKDTEFLMRFMAISTNGTYVFITNHSGIGNDHLEPTVGSYEVEYLNDLMVRLIVKYTQP